MSSQSHTESLQNLLDSLDLSATGATSQATLLRLLHDGGSA